MEENVQKDFFISYHELDCEWAEWISWQLEDAGYSCINPTWDFRPGSNSVLDIDNALRQANRIIAILSSDYFTAVSAQPEWAAAFVQDPTGTRGKLVPVRVGECKPEGLLASIRDIDIVEFNEAVARDKLLAGIQPGRVKPSEQPEYPGPTSRASSPLPEFPGKSNVLIASLGDSPAVISSIYNLLTKQEKLTIDRMVILCPEGEDVECAYKQVQKALSEFINEERVICESLPFQDADSWRHACIFLKRLYMLLRHHQEKGDTVYLSLAGGRKSMAGLMAWVVPFFPCIEKLYHVIDKGEQIRNNPRYFLSVKEIDTLSDNRFSHVMHPPLDQLILVDIPFEKGRQLGRDIRRKLATATINALAKSEYEEEQALIIGHMAIQGGEDPLIVRVTKEVEQQFNSLRRQDPALAREVKNGLLKLSETDVLQQSGADLDAFSFKVGKSAKAKRLLRYFKELEVPVHPVFYTDPNDIALYPDRQVDKVVICSLEREISGASYRYLQDVAASPEFSMKDGSDVADLIAPPEPADSVLIMPLGKAPMVVTQLYTLLEQRELRTIREVVLIYPGQSTLINSGAEIIADTLPNHVSCKKIRVPKIQDMDSPDACREFQRVLEAEIDRVRREYPLCKVDLALSGGRKGMTAMTIFAAQRKHIPFVHHTLITDEDLSERIAKETTIEELSETDLTEQQLKARLFLEEYEPYPYARFTLFRVPVFPADN